jgi:hypothetical protein
LLALCDEQSRRFALRARRERPRGRRTAEQRDEIASMSLIEWHPIPPMLP